jgi:hypothetical protein
MYPQVVPEDESTLYTQPCCVYRAGCYCQLCYLLAIIAESAMLAERYSLKPSFSELSPED